ITSSIHVESCKSPTKSLFDVGTKALENSKVSFSISNGGIYEEVGVNTFRNTIGAHYLPHSSEYVAPSSIDIVRPWFKTIGLENRINIDYASIFWEDIIIKPNKKQREKVVPYTRFLSLLMMQKIKKGYEDGETTCWLSALPLSQWYLKLSNPLPMLRGFPKAQSLELNPDTRSIKLLQNNPLCPAERQQKATGGLNSLGVASEERADPQLSSDKEVDRDEGLNSTSNIETKDDSVPTSSSPRSSQIQELTNQVLILQSQKHKLEFEKNKAEAEATLLKAQPSFSNVG
nr:hypothetical protein [Tanacetum cinerariifolium]